MAKKPNKTCKKTTTVREHPRHVSVTTKNPTGVTIVDKHFRRLPGTYLDAAEIEKIAKGYDRKKVIYPTAGKLKMYKNADKYDDQIAIWTDYFNHKFATPGSAAEIHPNLVKALIGSESDFRLDPPGNPKATGIAQITPETHIILQDPAGEAKEFIFNKIRKKDLKNPDIAIPMAIRWLHRKKIVRRIPTQTHGHARGSYPRL